MSTDTAACPQLPFPRAGMVDIAPLYTVLRRARPITLVRTPAGDLAWLVTGYAEAKELLADSRLGRSHPRPEQAARISNAGIMGGPLGNYDTEQRDHARMRRLLLPAFSAKRMRLLSGHVQGLVDDLITRMICARDGDAVDLQQHLSVPLPVYVICELLGVPFADRSHFKDLSERAATMTGDDSRAAMAELIAYTAGLADTKRHHPGEDVLSDLVAAQRDDPTFDDAGIAALSAGLLFAGHETTVHRISFGVLLLLTNPAEHRHSLLDDTFTVGGVVEEVLRLAAPGEFAITRYAHDDVTVGHGHNQVNIGRGDAVIFATTAANRDERIFADPQVFDPTRRPNSHLSFGFGPRFCPGASLARTELKAVFSTLFQRLPDLRLAVELSDLRLHNERVTGGLHCLPVTW